VCAAAPPISRTGEIEKLVRGGDDVAALRVQATVCRHCGERYFSDEAIRA
jgi:YgiT-type zinc finger domain-containing protein